MKKISLEGVLIILLLLFVILVVSLQIILSGPDTTKLETGLFSIIQFILSLAFSFMLARYSLKNEFEKSQRNFAIAAYRRIYEINIAVERLISRTSFHLSRQSNQESHELDVIIEMSYGIRESIRSSISDWADIIGDEIEKVEKITQLRKQKFEELTITTGMEMPNNSLKKLHTLDELIEKETNSLPTSLKMVTNLVKDDFKDTSRYAIHYLKAMFKSNGYLQLDGYQPIRINTDITKKPFDETLIAKFEEYISIPHSINIYSQENHLFGIINNPIDHIMGDREVAYTVLRNLFGKSEFEVQLIKRRNDILNEKTFFSVKVLEKGGVLEFLSN